MLIDINADLGEGFGPYSIADDEALMPLITSANVACGYHAGDPVIMDRTIRLARDHGVDLGAHVSFPDRMGFGRRLIQMEPHELEKHVLYQLGALYGLAHPVGLRIKHVNPHGALGNLASADKCIAETLVRAVRSFDPEIRFLVLPKSELEVAARAAGMSCWRLFLADRAYAGDGQLAPRALPGAVIKDEERVVARLVRLIKEGTVETIDGGVLRMEIDSVLIHSDTPGAISLARRIRQQLINNGVVISALSSHVRKE
ncbi:5-oxoprolinase subunit PxpA [Chelativorans sp. SCAU2101]|uniref:5-oxoprolinase subunit A n=1 Tax=Chelativorans petroleitrophicus TaxID=2975484 RepID=A0A9X2XCC8_9HYPH|nr:5-oxoprolinase subunit PxpA [Chelativorans petroleitrophicus]MCT8992261.1 5-oxoprolinase subunit PxpA [Chelativorans petroleitrophicus]